MKKPRPEAFDPNYICKCKEWNEIHGCNKSCRAYMSCEKCDPDTVIPRHYDTVSITESLKLQDQRNEEDMKIPRTTIKQIAETTVSETLDLEGLKQFFPSTWEKKLEELRKSRFKSVIFPD